jgi:uncharacterized protein (DUF1778 family)
MNKSERIYIRVTPEEKELIQDLANHEDRSMAKYLEIIIKKHLEKLKKEK